MTESHSSGIGQFVSGAILGLIAFGLAVLLRLLVVFGTGGVYEHRCAANAAEARQLINAEGWEADPGVTLQQVGCLYLRRPCLRLP